jgi:hypothetical protein
VVGSSLAQTQFALWGSRKEVPVVQLKKKQQQQQLVIDIPAEVSPRSITTGLNKHSEKLAQPIGFFCMENKND